MAKITVELDDLTLDKLARASQLAHVSVEEFLRRHTVDALTLPPLEIPNASHRKILAALDREDESVPFTREEIYDRDRARAEVYVQNRQRLLALVDSTTGDMGSQKWSRASLYER
jgi:hypothetical protein